jgi:hypothetical protein
MVFDLGILKPLYASVKKIETNYKTLKFDF